jgi:hypothetical protein
MTRKTEKAHFGQTIRSDSAPDNRSSHKVNSEEAMAGRKMKGGPTDISHSLGSAGEVQTYNNKGRKSRS